MVARLDVVRVGRGERRDEQNGELVRELDAIYRRLPVVKSSKPLRGVVELAIAQLSGPLDQSAAVTVAIRDVAIGP